MSQRATSLQAPAFGSPDEAPLDGEAAPDPPPLQFCSHPDTCRGGNAIHFLTCFLTTVQS